MKKLITILLLTATLAATAFSQAFQTYTNLSLDSNTVAASSTTLWGTNYLDATRYRSLILTLSGQGSSQSTNILTLTFKAGTATNSFEQFARYALSTTVYGTNAFLVQTQLDVAGIGWLKPFQIVSAVTNTITNATLTVKAKNYPRN